MDPAIWVALITSLGVVISAITGGVVAFLTHTKETRKAASSAADMTLTMARNEQEKALRERLALKNEKIQALQEQITDLRQQVQDLDVLNKKLSGELRGRESDE